MSKYNYLVSVFVGGKNVNLYFSENLDDLVTIRALYRNCDIDIFDIRHSVRLSNEQVNMEIIKSRNRWRQERETRTSPVTAPILPVVNKARKKFWERAVKCVETGQIFISVRKCSEHLGLSYKTIYNAVNSGNAKYGLHFIDVTRAEEDKQKRSQRKKIGYGR